jgi:hypothetical protein
MYSINVVTYDDIDMISFSLRMDGIHESTRHVQAIATVDKARREFEIKVRRLAASNKDDELP